MEDEILSHGSMHLRVVSSEVFWEALLLYHVSAQNSMTRRTGT